MKFDLSASPGNGEVGVPPGPLDVSGTFTESDVPEPSLDSITILLDGGAPVVAGVHYTSPPGASELSGYFSSPPNSFTVAEGPHRVEVAAKTDYGTIVRVNSFTVGAPPVYATLAATGTGKSAMVLTSPATVELTVSPSSSVTITSFPPITPPKVSLGSFTLTTKLTMVSSGTGTFNSADGSISIPDVEFQVDASISGLGLGESNTATVTITLTTGSSSSPAFKDAGTPLAPSGAVTLVGDGVYSTAIFGMTDFGIVLSGTISPLPL